MGRTLREIIKPYRITRGKGFRLKDIDPADTGGLSADKEEARQLLQEEIQRLSDLQEMLYAQDSWALLVVLQALDAAGKDSTIKHVMSGVNPQGCQVTSFKAPSAEELDHDFLWRAAKAFPERGRIGIFNRSYYEEVLVVRVHPELLQRQRLPARLSGKDIWEERYRDIAALESYLFRNGVAVCKFYLHLSREEQRRRFLERLEKRDKHWKFSLGDFEERQLWDRYLEAYQDAIAATASEHAPWYVVPADNKWFTRLVVAAAIIDALEGMELAFPEVPPGDRKRLEAVRTALEAEGRARRDR
ncbi:MAG TPA: polyphosphate kinase 2 family protein [Myxococcaceae bacterium]|nr:polyphosphate kinase 2 family protein [Myxococcaceae bacterium]